MSDVNPVPPVPRADGAADGSARVSVIIATYNRARLLPRALESVLRQRHENIEIVVVDDGSTDDTASVVAGFAARTSRPVRYLRKENGGCASARNTGAAHATGRWLLFLDSDDELEPDAIANLLRCLGESGADFVYAPAYEVDERGRTSLNPPVAAGRPERFAVEHFSDTNLRTGAYMLQSSRFRELGGFDESMRHNEDSDFVQRLAMESRACYSPVPSMRCHTHRGSKSGDRVAIYRALLDSSRRTLSHYPAFAAGLGDAGHRRLAELELALAGALVRAHRIDEAKAVLSEAVPPRAPLMRLALLTRSALPLRARDFFLGALRRVLVVRRRRPEPVSAHARAKDRG